MGAVLLVAGLIAYALIPAVHTTQVTSVRDVWVQNQFPIQEGSLVEQPRNVTVFNGMGNVLQANLTVTGQNGAASSIHFQLLIMNKSMSCSTSSRTSSILVDQDISRQSFAIPLNMTGTYCFVFDNQASMEPRTIDISARVSGTITQVLVARDGSANTVGLGLGAIGLIVAVYGYSRRTVIPWE